MENKRRKKKEKEKEKEEKRKRKKKKKKEEEEEKEEKKRRKKKEEAHQTDGKQRNLFLQSFPHIVPNPPEVYFRSLQKFPLIGVIWGHL